MNSETGAIAYFETDADAFRAGYDVPLDEVEVVKAMPLSRDERRKQYAHKGAAKRRKPRLMRKG